MAPKSANNNKQYFAAPSQAMVAQICFLSMICLRNVQNLGWAAAKCAMDLGEKFLSPTFEIS